MKCLITHSFTGIILLFLALHVSAQDNIRVLGVDLYPDDVQCGAERTELYFPLIAGKRTALVSNQTSTIGKSHLVDSLLSAGITITKVFCPEHGFRGEAEAGATVKSGTDAKTGLPVVSLYGNNNKPSASDLKDVDVVVFDIQDVGARFYTYISTLFYVMEACAENGKTLIVLDRPNPNGHYVDGPVLESQFVSFIGISPIPVVHGLTVAEFALMVNGEGWLKNGMQCDLKYIPVMNYSHSSYYHLPVRPSPNLPNMPSVWLYPSLCLFEGTVISVGRGTDKPFQIIGHPLLQNTHISFTPKDIPGVATNVTHKGKLCKGYDLSDFGEAYIKNYGKLYLFWLMDAYERLKDSTEFFNSAFDKLAGTASLRQQIINGASEDEIRKSWATDLTAYKKIRKKYLLYPDFE